MWLGDNGAQKTFKIMFSDDDSYGIMEDFRNVGRVWQETVTLWDKDGHYLWLLYLTSISGPQAAESDTKDYVV